MTRIIFIVCSFFVILWGTIIVIVFGTNNIYSNPFFRVLEFFIGATVAALQPRINKTRFLKWLCSWECAILSLVALITIISILQRFHIFDGDYMFYSAVVFILFVFMLISFSEVKSSNKIVVAIIKYISEVSYVFYFAQFFTWRLTSSILEISGYDDNMIKVFSSFGVCAILAVLMHEILERPILNLIHRKVKVKINN